MNKSSWSGHLALRNSEIFSFFSFSVLNGLVPERIEKRSIFFGMLPQNFIYQQLDFLAYLCTSLDFHYFSPGIPIVFFYKISLTPPPPGNFGLRDWIFARSSTSSIYIVFYFLPFSQSCFMRLGAVTVRKPNQRSKKLPPITQRIAKYGLLVLIVLWKRNRVNNSMSLVTQHSGEMKSLIVLFLKTIVGSMLSWHVPDDHRFFMRSKRL